MDVSKNRNKKKQNHASSTVVVFVILILMLSVCAFGFYCLFSVGANRDKLGEYERTSYRSALFQGELFAKDLCVAKGDVESISLSTVDDAKSFGLYDLSNRNVVYGHGMFDKVFPASTTKLMTAYLALKYGTLDKVITVGENVENFRSDEVVCGLKAGDQVTMYDLLCGLLLCSGNDCAVAIAEDISGSVEQFADLMNEEALALGASGTHFKNPHGLHDEDHYTTLYDLYLIFQACRSNSTFMEIISMESYDGTFISKNGKARTMRWLPTNYYSRHLTDAPDGIRVFGGKTGTTDQAGCCVALYCENEGKSPYISIIMGAKTKDGLYQSMNELLAKGISE